MKYRAAYQVAVHPSGAWSVLRVEMRGPSQMSYELAHGLATTPEDAEREARAAIASHKAQLAERAAYAKTVKRFTVT